MYSGSPMFVAYTSVVSYFLPLCKKCVFPHPLEAFCSSIMIPWDSKLWRCCFFRFSCLDSPLLPHLHEDEGDSGQEVGRWFPIHPNLHHDSRAPLPRGCGGVCWHRNHEQHQDQQQQWVWKQAAAGDRGPSARGHGRRERGKTQSGKEVGQRFFFLFLTGPKPYTVSDCPSNSACLGYHYDYVYTCDHTRTWVFWTVLFWADM